MVTRAKLREGQTRILFLGTGTSTGVPMIGCECSTCTSTDGRNSRLRASGLMSWMEGPNERSILIDTTTDLRQQALTYKLRRVDSVLFTHPHADHIHGLDELRMFNFLQKETIPCYGSEYTLGRIRKMFDYIFIDTQEGGTKPDITLDSINGEFRLFGRDIIPLPVVHGDMEVLGFRFGPIAYITDCNFIPDETVEKILDVPILILGAVRFDSHITHFSLSEAVEETRKIRAKKTYITHISHHMEHEKVSATLPENVFLSYDGLEETAEE